MRTPSRADRRWQQVLAHDAGADGAFVYAVRTTGVYCRPSCAARRPRREHVSFHDDGMAARAAGFRACRRCHPDEPAAASSVIAAACHALEKGGPVSGALRRRFLAATGLSARAWTAAARDARVRLALRQGRSVTNALYEAGFGSSSRFYDAADRALGMEPSRFRKGGVGERIVYTSGKSALGMVLAAETERGVCAILLGDTTAAVEAQLRQQFPRANLIPAGKAMQQRLHQVLALAASPAAPHALPLDLQGTAFERRVWQALRRIPAGSRVSYGELARRLGLPHAARAVARACAHNRLAVAVPCHRVVRANGELAGYRWGLERKQKLLKRERQA